MNAWTPTTTARRTLAVLLAAVLATAGALAAENSDLIVRAPAAEIAEIAARNGLTVVEQIAVPGDANEQGLFRLRAAEGASLATIITTVDELEPAVQGIEPVTRASLPELDQSVMALLDQSVMALLDGLEGARALTPPIGQAGPGLLGEPGKRKIKKIDDGDLSDETIVFYMQDDKNRRFHEVSLRAEFAPGCSVEYNRGTVPPVEGAAALEISGRKVKWDILNNTDAELTVSRVDVQWPAANLGLKKAKLVGEAKQLFAPPAVSIDMGDFEDAEDRRIDRGNGETLLLEFEADAALDQADYSITVTFAEGASVTSAPCAVIADNDPKYDKNKLKWTLLNAGHTDVFLEAVTIEWPTENGVIHKITFDGEPIFLTETEFGKIFDGKNEEDRFVWTGYVDQPAAAILRVDEAQKANKGYSTVAVIDTGVDPDHWLLAQALVPGYDFLRDEPGYASEADALLDQSVMALLDSANRLPLEEEEIVELNQSVMALLDADQQAGLDETPLPPAFGHGTMVAGVIHRVAPYASIMPLRVFDAEGHADLLDIVEAIYYAVDHGANVIHMSFSVESYSPELMRAINYAARSGVTCVASAGNQGQEKIVYPAAFGNTIGVASTTVNDEVSLFSNLGNDLVTVAAPGEAVVTTFPGGGWALASGTSFAAPWISGAAAIFADKNGREHQPGRADFFLASEALSHAVGLQGHGSGRAGHGRADLKEAVDKLKDHVEMGATGQSDYPYLILVDFAEGCSVAYPPQAFGGGCNAQAGAQLDLDGDKVGLEITNAGLATISIASVQVTWPVEHGVLKKVKLDGDTFFEVEQPAPAAVIDSGWKDPEKPEKRQIEPGDTLELRFEFDEDWTP